MSSAKVAKNAATRSSMPSVVVDASALVDLFIGSPAAGALFDRLFRYRTELHAPHSIDLEVAHATFENSGGVVFSSSGKLKRLLPSTRACESGFAPRYP